ncbi:hypothetical protein [Exiguobacterium sp. s192]|uniref:hypothetical protein n=1 Tax=Exiguobacterium sp. s192 TaxID=2751206 RepID=UPI001BE801F1|nr:hypothetical protein [Exiguobacterium sp. s192]
MENVQISEIITKLEMVLENQLTREEVSDWAYEQMTAMEWREEKENRALTKDQLAVFHCLTTVYGMDLQNSPTEYFHVDDDFRNWIKAFQEVEKRPKAKK